MPSQDDIADVDLLQHSPDASENCENEIASRRTVLQGVDGSVKGFRHRQLQPCLFAVLMT